VSIATLTNMADDPVTTVRRVFAAWTTGDAETLRAIVDSRLVIESLLGVLYERPTYRGREGLTEAFQETAGRWDQFEMRVEDARPAGERVIARVHVVVGKHGMHSDTHLTVVCTLRSGLIVSVAGDVAQHAT